MKELGASGLGEHVETLL